MASRVFAIEPFLLATPMPYKKDFDGDRLEVRYSSKQVPPPLAVLALSRLVPGLLVCVPYEPTKTTSLVMGGKVILAGDSDILRYIARITRAEQHLYGDAKSSNSVVALQETWVDHMIDLAPRCADRETLPTYIALLNQHLAACTFLVGEHLSIADLYVWQHLAGNTRWLTMVSPKQLPGTSTAESTVHLARWWRLLLNHPAVQYAWSHTNSDKKVVVAAAAAAGSDKLSLPDAIDGRVVTRFPPEPSGFLHLGHARAALLNATLASKYHGKLILRFDDTNPQKEKAVYVEAILADLARLGIRHDRLTHTSDSFPYLLEMATQLINENKAYVDDAPQEQMRDERKRCIQGRARTEHTMEQNLALWSEMQQGTERGAQCCLRARIDMASPNGTMRDPVLYRVNVATPHHRTGTTYKVYPTYDFACPIVDSIEGVTHVLRTTEYHDRNAQYEWMLQAVGMRAPIIKEFARLGMTHTVMSKRKLQWFVDQKLVQGWDDPRFPTVQGLLRRGLTIEALREFILGQGFADGADTTQEWDKLWTINKRVLDPLAPRLTALIQRDLVPLELEDNGEACRTLDVDLHPKHPALGKRQLTFSRRLLIEQEDARLIQIGEEVTLLHCGNVIVGRIDLHPETGVVVGLTGRLNPQGSAKTTSKKISWLDAGNAQNVPLVLVELDALLTVPRVEEGVAFESVVNPCTRIDTPAIGEPALAHLQLGQIIQVMRRGFFIVATVAPALQLIFVPDGKQ